MIVWNPYSLSDLSFTLLNEADPYAPAIYADRRAASAFKLRLYNNRSTNVLFRGAGPRQSELQISFSGFLSEAEQQRVRITAAGWSAQWRSLAAGRSALVLKPDADVSLAAHGSLEYALSDLSSAAQAPAEAEVRITFRNVEGLSAATIAHRLYLRNTADFAGGAGAEEAADAPLQFGFVGDARVYVSPAAGNMLRGRVRLFVANEAPATPLATAAWSAGGEAPRFELALPLGTGPQALTRYYSAESGLLSSAPDSPQNLRLRAGAGYRGGWTLPAGDEGPTLRSLGGDEYEAVFELKPTAEDNQAILDAGARRSLELELDGILTLAAPGIAPIYLRYYNLPGYPDGYRVLFLEKQSPPLITSFRIEDRRDGDATNAVRLSWKTATTRANVRCALAAPAGLELRDASGNRLDNGAPQPASAAGLLAYVSSPIPLADGERVISFAFTADDGVVAEERRIAKRIAAITSPPPQISIAVRDFSATPSTVTANEPFVLRWNVIGADRVRIEPGVGEVAASGERSATVTESSQFILTAVNATRTVRETRAVTVAVDMVLANRARRQADAEARIAAARPAAEAAGRIVVPYFLGQLYTNNHNDRVRAVNPSMRQGLRFNVPWDPTYSNLAYSRTLYPVTDAEAADFYGSVYGRVCQQSIEAGSIVDEGATITLNYFSD